MKTFDSIQSMISHNLKDPHSKALEPDCLSPPLAIMTQSLRGECVGERSVDGWGSGIVLIKIVAGFFVILQRAGL
jgi:hypothetical protein